MRGDVYLEIKLVRSHGETFFVYQSPTRIYKERISDIIYFERDKRKTMVHMMDGTEYTTYKHIDEFEKTVSDDFMRIHFSYLVNLQYVKEYHRNHLFLSDDSFVPISRKYEKGVKEYFEK